MQVWKNIKGFENYRICNYSLVVNNETNEIKTPKVIRGYYYVDLWNKDKRKNLRLGRLVAEHFIPNPNNYPQVNHKDGNRLNDNSSNLEWVTASQNILHRNLLSKRNGTYRIPRGNMKFGERLINQVRVLKTKGVSSKEIAKKLGMGYSTVIHILLGTRRSGQ